MKLPDCAFNINVKSAFTFWDPIILFGVTSCQRGAEIKKNTLVNNYIGSTVITTIILKNKKEALSLKIKGFQQLRFRKFQNIFPL